MPKTTHRKTIISWMMYDFANSSFANNVTTFIYAAFFTKVIAENEIIGTALWVSRRRHHHARRRTAIPTPRRAI